MTPLRETRLASERARPGFSQKKESSPMPGDPKECRQHALACVRLAQTSASPQAREEFANLARTWIASWAPLRPNGKPSRLRSGPRLTRVVANTLKVESTLSLGATEDGRCNASLQPRLHPFQALHTHRSPVSVPRVSTSSMFLKVCSNIIPPSCSS